MRFSRLVLFFCVVVLSVQLALGATIIDAKLSEDGSSLLISGTCDAAHVPVGVQASLSGNTVWFDQVTSNEDLTFQTTFILPQTGSYLVLAACSGSSAATLEVSGDGTVTVTGGDGGSDGSGAGSSDSSSSSGGSSGGGGGGGYCSPSWSCSEWSFCNANLEQTRECIDTKNCGKTFNKPNETKSCDACIESWICSAWSACSAGEQQRTCVDEHSCASTALKPSLTKGCDQATATGPSPSKISADLLPPQVQSPSGGQEMSFVERNKIWVLLGGVLLLIALIVFLVVVHLRHQKRQRLAYNYNELREWIKRESLMGTSKEDMKEILAEHTGWGEEEIEQAFSELQGEGNRKGGKSSPASSKSS